MVFYICLTAIICVYAKNWKELYKETAGRRIVCGWNIVRYMRYPKKESAAFYEFEQFDCVGVLKLFGDLTFRSPGEVGKAFLMSIGNSDHLVVDFKGVSKVDAVFVRHMKTLRHVTQKMRKSLTTINAAGIHLGEKSE